MEPTAEKPKVIDESRKLTPIESQENSSTLLRRVKELLESNPVYMREAAQAWFTRQPKLWVNIGSFPYEIEVSANPGTIGETIWMKCHSLDALGPKNMFLATDEKHKGKNAFIGVEELRNTEAALTAAESFIFDLEYEISRDQRDSSD